MEGGVKEMKNEVPKGVSEMKMKRKRSERNLERDSSLLNNESKSRVIFLLKQGSNAFYCVEIRYKMEGEDAVVLEGLKSVMKMRGLCTIVGRIMREGRARFHRIG
ncbi:unnamed protein product [Vicia faba]|uniref:Uncharacterized protein n=1 Tax=Vicia faba TaxID=3906 RepID=A0AAV1A363_VICFA|nr:unnamed protein product [Vicia faba]